MKEKKNTQGDTERGESFADKYTRAGGSRTVPGPAPKRGPNQAFICKLIAPPLLKERYYKSDIREKKMK